MLTKSDLKQHIIKILEKQPNNEMSEIYDCCRHGKLEKLKLLEKTPIPSNHLVIPNPYIESKYALDNKFLNFALIMAFSKNNNISYHDLMHVFNEFPLQIALSFHNKNIVNYLLTNEDQIIYLTKAKVTPNIKIELLNKIDMISTSNKIKTQAMQQLLALV